MATDPNEVHAWIRVCQDPKVLKDLSDFCQQRINLLRTPKGEGTPKQAFQNMTDHLSGGDLAPPMTGPGVHLGGGSSTAEQAEINDKLVQAQVEEGRRPDENLVRTVTVDGGDQAKPDAAKKPAGKDDKKPAEDKKPAKPKESVGRARGKDRSKVKP